MVDVSLKVIKSLVFFQAANKWQQKTKQTKNLKETQHLTYDSIHFIAPE